MGFTTTRVVDEEKIKIPPEKLIEDALYHQSRGEYDIAEKVFINAILSCKGEYNEKSIASNVKTNLVTLYTLWSNYYININDFYNAEYILNKQEKIADNNEAFRDLYQAWGDALASVGKIVSAENRYIKALLYETLSQDGTIYTGSALITYIKEIKYLYNSRKEQKTASKLFVIQRGKSFSKKCWIVLFIGLLCLSSSVFYLTMDADYHPSTWFPYLCTIIVFISPIFILFNFEIEIDKLRNRKETIKMYAFICPYCLIQTLIFVFGMVNKWHKIVALNALIFSVICILKSLKMFILYIVTRKRALSILNDIMDSIEPDEQLDLTVQ